MERGGEALTDYLFELPEANPQHPAKYTDALLFTFVRMLAGCANVLDPFGGTGKVFLLNRWYPTMNIQAVEIEPEWARINPRTTIGNALYLPFAPGSFYAVCTSPTYGNRMADGLCQADWNYITYAQKINRKLSADNSGAMQWGQEYRDFHVKAWTEAARVLRPGGVFVLNIKNHIRGGVEQPVTEWHIEALEKIGFTLIEHVKINTPSMRYGQNSDKRVGYESVIKFALWP